MYSYRTLERDDNVSKKKETLKLDELKNITDLYKQLTPANRYLLITVSGLMLANQGAEVGQHIRQPCARGNKCSTDEESA
jgi:hypothetical protein